MLKVAFALLFAVSSAPEKPLLQGVPIGVVANDHEPWFIDAGKAGKYGCFHHTGSELFTEGEYVFLMYGESRISTIISVATDRLARVYCIKF